MTPAKAHRRAATGRLRSIGVSADRPLPAEQGAIRPKDSQNDQGTRGEQTTRITVSTLGEVALNPAAEHGGQVKLASDDEVKGLLTKAAAAEGSSIDLGFLHQEWRLIVDACHVRDAESYLEAPRLGREVRVAASRGDELWRIFARARAALESAGTSTEAALMHRLAREMHEAAKLALSIEETTRPDRARRTSPPPR